MRSSTDLNELAAALAKAQGEVQHVLRQNKAYNYKYADLATVWDTIREPLTKNGLSIVQLPCEAPTGHVGLTTILLHSSGQSLTEKFYMPVKNPTNAQDVGSALTYARRYALMAAVGVAPEDDDGAAAAGKTAPVKLDTDKLRADLQKQFDEAKEASEKKRIALETRGSPIPQDIKDKMLKNMSDIIKGMSK